MCTLSSSLNSPPDYRSLTWEYKVFRIDPSCIQIAFALLFCSGGTEGGERSSCSLAPNARPLCIIHSRSGRSIRCATRNWNIHTGPVSTPIHRLNLARAMPCVCVCDKEREREEDQRRGKCSRAEGTYTSVVGRATPLPPSIGIIPSPLFSLRGSGWMVFCVCV